MSSWPAGQWTGPIQRSAPGHASGGRPILLDGICWLPAQAVAAAFGRTAAISGDQLVLPAEEGSVVLTAGSLTGERDDRPFALSSLPFQWEGEFYLSLEDLCALLELTARREEGLISLIPRSAPSALLPEELPPIQPLPLLTLPGASHGAGSSYIV